MKTFERLRFFLIIGASTRRSSTDGCQYFFINQPYFLKKNIKQMKIEKGACRFDALGSVQQHLIVPQRFHHHPSICTFTHCNLSANLRDTGKTVKTSSPSWQFWLDAPHKQQVWLLDRQSSCVRVRTMCFRWPYWDMCSTWCHTVKNRNKNWLLRITN